MLHSCFPERLKSLRQEKNMLQQDLAEHLKVSKSTVSGWERYTDRPRGRTDIITPPVLLIDDANQGLIQKAYLVNSEDRQTGI